MACLLVVAALGAKPGYWMLQRMQWHRLTTSWAEATALEDSRTTALSQLAARGTATDAAALHAAALALYRQEAAVVRRLASGMGSGQLVIDAGLRRLAGRMRTALLAQATQLERAARYTAGHPDVLDVPFGPSDGQPASLGPPPPPDGAANLTALQSAVYAQLPAEQRRFGGGLPVSRARLTAADQTLRRLARWSDQPLDATLLVDLGSQLAQVDLAAQRASWLVPRLAGMTVSPPSGQLLEVLPRQGWLALVASDATGTGVYALWTGASAPVTAHLLGHAPPLSDFLAYADPVSPAHRPDAIWIAGVGPADRYTVSEVDASGDRLAGPFPLPGGAGPTGFATGSDLVLSTGLRPSGNADRLLVDNPATGTVLARLGAGCVVPLGAGAGLVAWASCGPAGSRLYLFRVATGADHVVALPGGVRLADPPGAAVSPNGRWVGVAVLAGGASSGTPTPRLAVINTGTGAVQLVGGAEPSSNLRPSLAWTPDSRRLFFTTEDANATLATWQVGTRKASDLRYHGATPSAGASTGIVVEAGS